MRVCISSGHSTKCQGAIGVLNEVEEATAVVDEVARCLHDIGVPAMAFHDTVSTSQDENLNRIVDWHNSHARDLDVSVHFNASENHQGCGVEVFYQTEAALAAGVSLAISDASGLKNRGAKPGEFFFLTNTAAPAILVEVCFCDNEADAEIYRTYWPLICYAIANAIGGGAGAEEPEPDGALFHAEGKCSYFGGPEDTGVSSSEGLAFHYDINTDNQHLFLPLQPSGTDGLARRLNAKAVHYIACRWDYEITPKKMLAESGEVALVTNMATGIAQTAFPADWGPNESTGRVADLSPALMRDLDLETDDRVDVIYPWRPT